MKKVFDLIVFLLLVFQFACKEKSSSKYESCCGTLPTVDAVLLDTTGWPQFLIDTMPEYARVYIPNVFAPGPPAIPFGYISTFTIYGGIGFSLVLSAVYTNENGEALFNKENFYPYGNDPATGWDGLKPDSTYYYGPFDYVIKVKYFDGKEKTYVGKACSFKCGDSGFPSERLPDCFFPEQNNGNGQPDQSLPLMNACF